MLRDPAAGQGTGQRAAAAVEGGSGTAGEADKGTAEGVTAFAANQRDEVRDLHDVAAALSAQPGMKQQTFIAGMVAKGNEDRFLSPEKPTALSSGGQEYPCILAAAFSAGAGAAAGSIGYSEKIAPTLKGTASGNSMPSVLCLNDQGGGMMETSDGVTGTLRAQMKGHPSLVLGDPTLFENHAIDARYTGPHAVSPTMSARYGTGGNNQPLVVRPQTLCISGNILDREPHNGGNGFGFQKDVAYTLNTADRHAIFSRQRVDRVQKNDAVGTQSARQHKDAADFVCSSGGKTACPIRRLTPLECERLQGFPDGWTALPGAADSARYKALGNSVAIPCVAYVLHGIVLEYYHREANDARYMEQ